LKETDGILKPQAVQVLVKAVPDITYPELEIEFRDRGFKVYLIAMEKEIESTQTIVNLQGKIGCKYAVFYFLSDKPQRPNMKERWPKSAEENLERLEDAGVPMDSGVVKCNNVRILQRFTGTSSNGTVQRARPYFKEVHTGA
jgi:hypothetical protein